MLGKSPDQDSPQADIFRPLLGSFINLKAPLVVLGKKTKGASLEEKLKIFYAANGAPSKPIRLMAGLLILKQMFNKSDEVVVEDWFQSTYYQYFMGEIHFQWGLPCDASDLVHFRSRIGEDGVKAIFSMSLELHKEKISQSESVISDTTVQEKNVTFPTDTKLRLKIIVNLRKIAKRNALKLKQSFEKELKELKIKLRFLHHPKRRKQANKAQKRIKTIAGKLLREVKGKLQNTDNNSFNEILERYGKVLEQVRNSKNKIYSLHEPQVACIAKGKAHKPYEFGSKIAVTMLPKSNIIVDMSHFEGNPHDSKTLETVLNNLDKDIKKNIKEVIVDRGYGGKKMIQEVEVIIPNPKADSIQSADYQKAKSKKCKSRAAIEPIIGHLKHDCRMLRNYLKGIIGDKINAILAGAAFNFRIALREVRQEVLFLFNFQNTFCFLRFSNKRLI